MHCSNLWYSNDYGAVFTLQEAIEQTIGNATLADISGSSTAGTVPSTEDLSEYFPVSFSHLLSSDFQTGEKCSVVHKHCVNLVECDITQPLPSVWDTPLMSVWRHYAVMLLRTNLKIFKLQSTNFDESGPLADPNGGTYPPPHPQFNFFYFHAVFGKNLGK